jgi:lysozyme
MDYPVNDAAVALIKEFEGFANPVAGDGWGNATGGWGHTGGGIRNGQPVSVAQAEQWLHDDLTEAVAGIRQHLPGLELTGNQLGALAALCFNSGGGDLSGTQLQKFLLAKNWQAAADHILAFDHVGSQVVYGLLRRCEAERILFLTPDSGAPVASGWVIVVGKHIGAQIIDGSAYGPLRQLCEALYGAQTDSSLAWDSDNQEPTWNGASMGLHDACRLIAGSAWVAVRPFAAWAGCNVSVSGETVTLSH